MVKNYFQLLFFFCLNTSLCLDSDTHEDLSTKNRRKFVVLLLKYMYFQCGELIRFWTFQLECLVQKFRKHNFFNDFIVILRKCYNIGINKRFISRLILFTRTTSLFLLVNKQLCYSRQNKNF